MDSLEQLPRIPASERTAVNSSSSSSVATVVAIILARIPELKNHEKSILDVCTNSSRWLDFLRKSSDDTDDDNKTYNWLVEASARVRGTLMSSKQQRNMNRAITDVKKEALGFSKLPRLDYLQLHSIYFDDYVLGYQRSFLSVMIAMQAFEAFMFYCNGYAHLEPCKICVRCRKAGQLFHCKRCRLATYCSRECQVEDWKDSTRSHAEFCTQLSYSYQYVQSRDGSFYLQPALHGCRIFPVD